MAPITPSTILEESSGSLKLHIATFAATVDDSDTYASGLGTQVVGYWGNCTDDPSTATLNGIDVSLSSGTFTFHTAEDNRGIMLYILSKT